MAPLMSLTNGISWQLTGRQPGYIVSEPSNFGIIGGELPFKKGDYFSDLAAEDSPYNPTYNVLASPAGGFRQTTRPTQQNPTRVSNVSGPVQFPAKQPASSTVSSSPLAASAAVAGATAASQPSKVAI